MGNKTNSQQLRMPQSTAHKILHNFLRFKSSKTVLVMSLSRVTDMLQCREGTIYKQCLQVHAMVPCSATFVLYSNLFQPSLPPYTMTDVMSLNMFGELLLSILLEEGPMTHYSIMLQYFHIFTYQFRIIQAYLSR